MLDLMSRMAPAATGVGTGVDPPVTFRAMDTRGVGKPLVLTKTDARDKEKFRQWRIKLTSWYRDQWSDAKFVLRDVELHQAIIVTLEKLGELDLIYPGTVAFSSSLESLLIHLCQDETFTIATVGVPADDAAGLEMYRRLSRKYDPQGGDLELAQLRKILKSDQVQCPALKADIEQSEEAVRLWNLRNPTEPVPQFILRLVLNDKVCEPLRTHLDLKMSSLRTYDLLREEIVAYLNVLESKDLKTTTEGGNAMDVDLLAQLSWVSASDDLDDDEKEFVLAALAKAKGKGKGKGKSDFPPCRGCGKTNHLAKHCFVLHPELWKQRSGQPSSSSSSASSSSWSKKEDKKGGKGGGKGKGKGINELEENEEETEEEDQEEEDAIESLDVCGFDLLGVESFEVFDDAGRLLEDSDDDHDLVDLSHIEAELLTTPTASSRRWYRNLGDKTVVLFGVDSCAAASACPPAVAHLLPVLPTATSGKRQFKAAGGMLMEDQGDRRVVGLTEDGSSLALNMTITPVCKPLIAVSAIEAKGGSVSMGAPGGSFLKLSSGKKIPLYLHRGIYVLPLYLDNVKTGGVDFAKGAENQAEVFSWLVV